MLHELTQDVRFAVRLLRRDRGFAVTAVFVLGIGIGVNNMFYTILHAHTLRGLPIAHADRIVYISTFDDRSPDRAMSYADYTVIRESARGLASVAAFTSASVTIAGDARAAERLEATFVSANAFDLIGASPAIGRGFVTDDDRDGAAAVVMLGRDVWRSRYGADASVIGRSVLVNGAPATIVGIVADRSGFPATGQIWLTLGWARGLAAQPGDARTLRLLGRMKDGVTVTDVRTEIEGIVNRLSRDFAPANRNLRARVMPINDRYFGRLGDPAWRAFIAAAFLVALISCANAANLMLARSVRRARELAIRTSLGATRPRLLRQLLIEGFVLAAAGGVFGLAVSLSGVQVFKSAIPEGALPYWVHYSLDGRVIAALVLVSMATVILFALLPAFRASKADVNRVLKDGGRPGAGDRATGRWATAFLVAEFALAVVLLAQIVVNFRGGTSQVLSDRSIDTRAVVTASVAVPLAKYATPSQRIALFQSLEARALAIPGVSSVSIASAPPLAGAAEARVQIAGAPDLGSVRSVIIGARYFHTLEVPLTRGRDFDAADGGPGQPSAIVNERFVDQFLAGRDPIGQRISLTAGDAGAPADAVTIVGVASDVRQRPADVEAVVYLPYRASAPANMVLLVRNALDPGALVPLLRTEVLAQDPDLPVYRIQTMADVVRSAWWNRRLSQRLILFITFIAVALSTVGLYAVTAHGVAQRTQEIGVRMALGARPRQVVFVVARRVLVQVVLGFAAGIVCTLAWQRAFSTDRVDLSVMEPGALASIAATLVVAALIACYVPARRAIRLDPMTAIRGE